MVNRITLMASAIGALVVSASAFLAQPGQAQTTAQATAQAKENECLSRPKGVAPKGSHWFYRLDRANGNRRCWYLGPESQKVRRAAPERKAAAAAPAPAAEREAPPLPRARAASRSVAPAADANTVESTPANIASPARTSATTPSTATPNTPNTTDGPVTTSTVTAPGLSAAWPAAASNAPSAAGPSDREGATAASTGDAAEATTTTAQEIAPSASPTPVSADAAAAENSAPPAPGFGHVLLFLAALGAFIIIAVRALVKLLTPAPERIEPAVRRAAPIIRQRAPERRAFDHITEPATQEGHALRPLDIASRWDTAPTRWDTTPRLPRTPNVPLYDDSQHDDAQRVEDEARRLREAALYTQEGPALRRRRRVA